MLTRTEGGRDRYQLGRLTGWEKDRKADLLSVKFTDEKIANIRNSLIVKTFDGNCLSVFNFLFI